VLLVVSVVSKVVCMVCSMSLSKQALRPYKHHYLNKAGSMTIRPGHWTTMTCRSRMEASVPVPVVHMACAETVEVCDRQCTVLPRHVLPLTTLP